MKKLNILFAFITVLVMMLNVDDLFSQATGDNTPGPLKFLGFSGAQNLEVRTNNTTYMQMMQNGNSTINGFNINRSGFVGLSQNPTFFTTGPQSPFSLLHLNGDNNAGNAQEIGYRSWMRHGITLTHNQDLMFVGQRRLTNDVTDAVIAWADNDIYPGPDNLCFVFTKGDGSGTTPTEPETNFGREIARMTAVGHTGIGIQWTNTFQPKRTLDVVRHDNTPQFRITRLRSSAETGGIYTDFETSSLGHLHILPRNGGTRNVGIGFLSGTSTPTERLDVYDGTARLRQVPANEPHVLITGRKQDVDPTDGDYVLNHLDFNGSATQFLAGNGTWQNGTNVCDWTITGQNLSTGHAGSCLTGNVAVGRFASNTVRLDALVGTPNAIGSNSDICAVRGINNADGSVNNGILAVAAQLNQSETVGVNRGGYFIAANARESGHNIGVYSVANDLNSWGSSEFSYGLLTYSAKANNVYGVFSRASRGNTKNIGVYGLAEGPEASTTENIGVWGHARGANGVTTNIGVAGYATSGVKNYGVYGQAPVGAGSYAGYFTGNFTSTGTFLLVSDEQFKTNVEDYNSGLEIINQLAPKTYDFLHEQYPKMSLSQGNQYGLIAQELAQVVPELVGTVIAPTLLDSLGNEISSSIEYQAVNYIGLIPILISAVKEQQTQITSQDEAIAQLQESLNNQNEALAQMMDQLAVMQQQINQCCSADDGTKTMPNGVIQPQDLNNQKSIDGGNELYQNIPNPFRESTTISYQLEEGGRVQLAIYDGNGKVVTMLVDANQENGRYSEVWNANGMPAGVYHYALYVDGELLVKRAIKLQE